MFTSEQLTEGDIYARDRLRYEFDIKDATLNTGVFQPSGSQSIWLFVTENKTKGSTQYKDQLHEDTLYWDGQKEGRTDQLIIEHETRGLEILVFYRKNKYTFPNYGFRYEGRFRYISHTGFKPTHFVLQRVAHELPKNSAEPSASEDDHRENAPSTNIAVEDKSHPKSKKPGLKEQAKHLELVYCYAREDRALLDELDKHLSVLKRLYQVVSWSDYEITPGMEWEKEIDSRLNTANIILLLVSPDFMASDYCYGVEMKRAIERHERGEARVIPVILRPIGWRDTPIGKLQALPKNAKPVVDRDWYTLDYALHDVEEGVKVVINQLLSISRAS